MPRKYQKAKSKVMVFSGSQPGHSEITIDGEVVEQVLEFNFLDCQI
jgi:hypothetical protein